MTQVPEGAQRSPDGHYWLDSTNQWQPVPADDPQHPDNAAGAAGSAASSTGAAAASGSPRELTREDLAHITTEEQIDERSHPYFAPDYATYPNDTSASEAQDHLSDEPAQGGM